jgi:hypothetical protein
VIGDRMIGDRVIADQLITDRGDRRSPISRLPMHRDV